MRHQINVVFEGIESLSPEAPQYFAVATVERDSSRDWIIKYIWVYGQSVMSKMADWQISEVEKCVEQYFLELDHEAN